MAKENLIKQKSFDFALKIIELYKHLAFEKREFILSKQILKSGTSIGANVEEAIGSQSRRDFLAKISIAYKESRESKYWLRLIKESNLLLEDGNLIPLKECTEIVKILGSIQKTMKESLKKPSNS